MDFPNFENINENNNYIQHEQENTGAAGHDEVEIESMEFNTNNNYNQGLNDNYVPSQSKNANYSNMPWENSQVNEMNFGHTHDDVMDENERKRIEERKTEEEQRRAKIIKKMNDELRIKQEWRDKAVEYIDNWRTTRENNIRKRHEFNKDNETDFLNNRGYTKDGKKNPWEKVVENIEIKESDYKGTKDVSRMRTVILNRKGDFTQMKMK